MTEEQRQAPAEPGAAPEPHAPLQTGEPVCTRRQMLILSGAALAGMVLPGCGGGSLVSTGGGDGGGGSTSPALEQLALNTQATTLTTDRGAAVGFLGTARLSNSALASFWGTADAGGIPTRILQALYWQDDPLQGVRVEYDGQGLPTRLEQEANGAFVLLFWDVGNATLKFYQPDGTYVGGASVAAPGLQVTQLPDSKVVGYFSGTLDGLKDAIVTFTIGGDAAPTAAALKAAAHAPTAAARPLNARGQSLTADQTAKAKAIVAAVAGPVTQSLPDFVRAVLKSIGDGYVSTGKSGLGGQIVTAALNGTGVSPVFLNGGLPLMGGLSAISLLGEAAKRIQQRLAQDPTTVTDGTVAVATSSPSPADYRSTLTFKTTRPASDPTGVRGIVGSRELDTFSVVGYVQPSGALFLSGTAKSGAVIELRGTVAGGQVSAGQWLVKGTLPAPALRHPRDGGGNNGAWNAAQKPLGQCMEQQNSGGQGLFSETYDLGKCGTFPFFYNAYVIPDHFQIFQDDNIIYDTGGEVSGEATIMVTAVGQTTLIRVVVIANEQGTAWTYTVGCPP